MTFRKDRESVKKKKQSSPQQAGWTVFEYYLRCGKTIAEQANDLHPSSKDSPV